jgi:DNA-binding CsgD family transcriptional regulator/tetratricopeptide (TPR) repeat protein
MLASVPSTGGPARKKNDTGCVFGKLGGSQYRRAVGSLSEGIPIELLEREDQLRCLSEAFAQARAGKGRIIAIAAEAGAGKTALIERFVASGADGARVYWGACENLSTPEVLLPLRDIARASGEAFDLQSDHIRAFESMLRLLSQGGAPALLIIEDVHWADTATLDLIRFLGRRIARVRALILITYRDEEVDARSPVRTVLGEAPVGSVVRMTLEPLSLAAVTTLAAKAGRRAEQLYALTAGNPFLVTEALAVEGDVPTEAVRDSTLARASRLCESARVVLEAVSLFPRHAETAVVADLVKGVIDTGLDDCVEKGMLSLEGGLVQFRHELARRAIEASVPPTRRRALHQKVVDVLKRRTDARASEIAHHAERAGDSAALLKFARLAGEEAAKAGAPREAASHFAAMLRHRDALPPDLMVETLERHGEQAYLMGSSDLAMISMAEAAELRRRANDTLKLGQDLTRLTRFAWMCARRAEAERFVDEAIAVLQQAPPGPELAWAYSHQSQLDMLASRMDSAIGWGQRALELAQQLGEKEIIIHALGNIGSAKADDRGATSIPELAQSFDLALAGKYHDHVERASCNLSCSYYWRRDYQSALAYIERGVAYADSLDLPHWEGYLRGWRAMVWLDQGELSRAEEEAQEICSRSYAAEMYRFPALIALARVRIRRGDQDAETPFAAARRLATAMAEPQRIVYIAMLVAEDAWQQNDATAPAVREAKCLLSEVHALAEQRNAYWVAEDAALWLYMLGEPVGESAKFSNPFRDHCQGRWESAATGWRSGGRPYEEALALCGGDEAAQRHALEIFDRLGAAPAAARMRRQLRAGGSRAVPRGPIAGTRANAAGLTRRQVEVLGLVGEGLSNTEIAGRLCISAKTAEHHVSAIMARLDVPTRQEAAAAARARGLLK